MDEIRFFQKLQDVYSSLTPSEKQVADYLSNNLQVGAFLTCVELGRAAGVSDTTVIRLANVLGFAGYAQMKKALQVMVRSKLSARDKLSTSIEQLGDSNYLQEIFDLEKYNLEQTYHMNDPREIERAVVMLDQARKILVMGLGLSASVVRFLVGRLCRVRKDVSEITTGGHVLVEKMAVTDSRDVLMAFDFPSYSHDVRKALQYMKENIGGRTLLITDRQVGELQAFADITLTANTDAIGFTNSITGAAMLSNMVSVGLALRNQEKALDQFSRNQELAEFLGHSFKL